MNPLQKAALSLAFNQKPDDSPLEDFVNKLKKALAKVQQANSSKPPEHQQKYMVVCCTNNYQNSDFNMAAIKQKVKQGIVDNLQGPHFGHTVKIKKDVSPKRVNGLMKRKVSYQPKEGEKVGIGLWGAQTYLDETSKDAIYTSDDLVAAMKPNSFTKNVWDLLHKLKFKPTLMLWKDEKFYVLVKVYKAKTGIVQNKKIHKACSLREHEIK